MRYKQRPRIIKYKGRLYYEKNYSIIYKKPSIFHGLFHRKKQFHRFKHDRLGLEWRD